MNCQFTDVAQCSNLRTMHSDGPYRMAPFITRHTWLFQPVEPMIQWSTFSTEWWVGVYIWRLCFLLFTRQAADIWRYTVEKNSIAERYHNPGTP
ncbi:unnamed protein product [Periconia digitata]|uniref:Uncharacterized protein n=1 Tax=Periconia digitata TaxID=1303443 RepID=A0A9W4UT13_9PLEO|nr:unnamed protein product [Periconia digitata]